MKSCHLSPRHPSRQQRFARGRALLTLSAACLATLTSYAQQPATMDAINPDAPQVTLNFRDADLSQVVNMIAQLTGKVIIIDPRTGQARVTVLSTRPLTPEGAYQALLSTLQVHGFVATTQGNVIKITSEANERQMPSIDLPASVSRTSDELVTQVISPRNLSATALMPVLRPLQPQQAHLAALQQGNMLVISDRAANVSRLIRIIERMDQEGDDALDIVHLENASASEIQRTVNTLSAGGQGGEPGGVVKIVADDRTNSILLNGDKTQRMKMKALITYLDTPVASGGDTQIIYLHYAVADDMVKVLKDQVQGIVQSSGQGGPLPPGAAAAPQSTRDVQITADKYNNAVLVTAPAKVMKSIKTLIDKLDIRRAQVLIEVILVEMQAEKTAELGVNWIVGPADATSGSIVPVGIFSQPVAGTSIGSLAQTVIAATQGVSSSGTGVPSGALSVPTGATLGAGRIASTGTDFLGLIRAVAGDAHTNIISTPSIVTLDNQEAKIEVAQEVPFITGQFASTGGSSAGGVNPFQTIQRQKVGTILKITPQIDGGSSVRLKIDQEASSLAQSVAGAVDLITNTRNVSTNVIVENGGILVMGGLISDTVVQGENRVPLLGKIPLIGNLFKTRNATKRKTNLMLFIRPVILGDGVQTAIETNAKYNLIRDALHGDKDGKIPLLHGERQPTLPALQDLSKYADPTQGAQPPSPDTDPTQLEQQQQTTLPPARTAPATPPTTPPDSESTPPSR